ncbi:cytochrome c biogenesis protein CcdA [Methanolobus zinderi]|uniref:Cytochrome c biogenesis protein CcdA n=1 Tax=Methanolobus zinderi TaxID=536044 RepID=A0A7D5I646_9EURY|nr:cytochrome c biogenesis CcdA family protein [Methanolobus zinderi]QLC50923.1 cytochrome c biogenesis protein CcdA [Methanolobus zinderi]
MSDTLILDPIASFVAGVVSILSPCVLPLLPVILAYSTDQSRLRPFAVVVGLSFTFVIMGIAASAFGAIFQTYIQFFRILAEILIIIFGLAMLADYDLFGVFAQYTGKLHVEKKGMFGGLLVGASLGIVWIPCVGPILGAILMGVAIEGNIVYGATHLLIYSIGFAIPMLLIAYFANLSSARLNDISRFDVKLKKLAGLVLVLAGLWMIYSNHLVFYL